MTKAKRQHWVPRLYLKQFATDDTKHLKDKEKTWVFDTTKPEESPHTLNIKNFAVQNYLYTPINNCGERNWKLDDSNAEIEDLTSKVWPHFASSPEPVIPISGTGDSKEILSGEIVKKLIAMFLANLYVRNPVHKEVLARATQKYLGKKSVASNHASSERESSFFEPYIADLDKKFIEGLQASDKSSLENLFLKFVEIEKGSYTALFYRKYWQIIFSQSPTFLSSDNPIVVLSNSGEIQSLHSVANDGLTILFPISPTKLLIMKDRKNEKTEIDGYFEAVREQTVFMNHMILKNAKRFICSNVHTNVFLNEIIEG